MPPKAAARRTAAKPEDSDSTQNGPAQIAAAPGASGRPSVQRLQSLKKRAPAGGSITPATRSPSVLGGDPTPKPMKFRPKAVQRRSKEEREAMEKIEQERLNDRLRDAAAIQRGRGNRGGRGNFRGRGGAGGSGSFGGAFRGRGGGFGRGRARFGISGGSREREDDSSDDELRMSIDQINIESDEDDEIAEDGKGKMPMRGRREKGLRPVRVTRHEHEERAVAVNMESSSSKAAEILQQAQQEAAEAVDDRPTPPETLDEGPRVKDEPTDDADTPMEDLPAEDDGLLPRQRYRVRRKTSDPQSAEPKKKEVAPPAPKRDPRELLRTKEEIDEYDRHLDDLEHVRDLLTHQEPEPEPEPESEEPQTVPETTPGEDATDDPEPPVEKLANQHLLGHLFLMQFPPMTPNLCIPGSTDTPVQETTRPEPQVKSENEGEDVQFAGESGAGSTGKSKLITAATNWSLPAGRVGKLNVHKSGRVIMDWGGISFELDRAAAVDFVQEALIVSSPDPEEAGQPPKDDTRHQAWSMGQLSGKFTVMPNWDAML